MSKNLTKYDVRYSAKYRANPTNFFHAEYQSERNHLFITIVSLIVNFFIFVNTPLIIYAAVVFISVMVVAPGVLIAIVFSKFMDMKT